MGDFGKGPHSIQQRTPWDAQGDHTIWCGCGQVLTATSASAVEQLWAVHSNPALADPAYRPPAAVLWLWVQVNPSDGAPLCTPPEGASPGSPPSHTQLARTVGAWCGLVPVRCGVCGKQAVAPVTSPTQLDDLQLLGRIRMGLRYIGWSRCTSVQMHGVPPCTDHPAHTHNLDMCDQCTEGAWGSPWGGDGE